MPRPKRFIFWFLVAIWLEPYLFAYSSQTENIPPRDYYATVQRELAKAKKSITVCMYLFTFRPNQSTSRVFQLADSLKKAHDAGVRVEVILDQNINFTEGEDRASDLSEGKNAPAYTFLKAQGIPVFYDDSSTYTHSKAVVIDEETVIAGSTNWSESALTRNQEINFLIRSKEVARDVLATLQAIPRQNPMPNADLSTVDLPGEFLEDTSLLARMTAQNDERAFDTYLYLVKHH
jgi:phosphatidylserine/phosphatidylglycerophosphate/cardiolipin synthase-like enzyme